MLYDLEMSSIFIKCIQTHKKVNITMCAAPFQMVHLRRYVTYSKDAVTSPVMSGHLYGESPEK